MLRPIEAIVVGERRREDYGDLESLAASIARYGLLHPIVIDDDGHLVAGERRLRACQQLGWPDVPTRSMGDLSEQERREIELEENLRRKDLTAYERSRTLAAMADTAREIAQTETCTESVQVSGPQRGPSRTAGSVRDIANRTGLPTQTIRDAQQHVAAVERYPELEPLPQQPAVQAAKVLDSLPDAARAKARQQLREEARDEHMKSQELLTRAGIFDDPTVQRAQLIAQFTRGYGRFHSDVLMLNVAAVAAALPQEDIAPVRRFLSATRDWCDQLETALQPGLRVVGQE